MHEWSYHRTITWHINIRITGEMNTMYFSKADLQDVAMKRDKLQDILKEIEIVDPLLAEDLKEKINDYTNILIDKLDKYVELEE